MIKVLSKMTTMNIDTEKTKRLSKLYVKKVRAQLDVTQVDFAKMLGTSHDTVKKYEMGAIHPSLPIWFKIQSLDERLDFSHIF
jgi:DNA-binding transcriptional regulator YiaG